MQTLFIIYSFWTKKRKGAFGLDLRREKIEIFYSIFGEGKFYVKEGVVSRVKKQVDFYSYFQSKYTLSSSSQTLGFILNMHLF